MHKQFTFKNFRGFRDLTVNLKPLTVINGKNNTGKTSLLEGLFLFHDFADTAVFLKLLVIRGQRDFALSDKTIFDPLFHGMDNNNDILLQSSENKAVILKKNPTNATFFSSKGTHNSNYDLSCLCKENDLQLDGIYKIKNEQIILESDNDRSSVILRPIQYIGPNTAIDNVTVANWLGKVELMSKKHILIDSLKILDEDIVDIVSVVINSSPYLYITTCYDEKMPLYLMGDGMRKIVHVMLAIILNNIVLLDEIENGLHYKLHPKIWKLIAELSAQENCQVIATTHNDECIEGALEGAVAAGRSDDFMYMRLDKIRGEVRPKYFTSSMLQLTVDKRFEVR